MLHVEFLRQCGALRTLGLVSYKTVVGCLRKIAKIEVY